MAANNTQFILSHIDVINNKDITRGTKLILFDENNKRYTAAILAIEQYAEEVASPNPQDTSKVWGNVKISYSYIEGRETVTAREIFVVHKQTNGKGFLYGHHSLALVPNSTEAVKSRKAAHSHGNNGVRFNPYHIQNGLDAHTRSRIEVLVSKLQDIQDKTFNNQLQISTQKQKKVVKYLRKLNTYLLDGVRNVNKLDHIHKFISAVQPIHDDNSSSDCDQRQNDAQQNEQQQNDQQQNDQQQNEKKQNDQKENDQKSKKKKCKEHKCPFCTYTSTNKTHLRRKHIYEWHTDKISDWVVCDLCNDKFPDARAVKKHKKQGSHKVSRVQIQSICPLCKSKGKACALFKAVMVNNVHTKVFCCGTDCKWNGTYIGDSAEYHLKDK